LPTWVYPWPVLTDGPLLLVIFGRILVIIGKVSLTIVLLIMFWGFWFGPPLLYFTLCLIYPMLL
jgi:hypothetical protein